MKNTDKYRGCLIGGAAGDALGYAVEFYDEEEIFSSYGGTGITEYKLTDGVAQISDDTQMTLFTASGLLLAAEARLAGTDSPSYQSYVALCYKDWLRTQLEEYPIDREDPKAYSRLVGIPQLFSRRAPGRTCITAILDGANGTVREPINDSKGCGGVMRVSPVGLFFENDEIGSGESDMMGAEIAAITHGHELGYIPAAALTHIIRRLAHEDIGIEEAVLSAIASTEALFKDAKSLPYYLDLQNRAVELSKEKDIDDLDAIHLLGKGWVAEETLAIATYCALRYPDDIDKALIAAVNHEGDSDSTGAVTGNIVGAHIGLSKIPKKYTENLELYDTIIETADLLTMGFA